MRCDSYNDISKDPSEAWNYPKHEEKKIRLSRIAGMEMLDLREATYCHKGVLLIDGLTVGQLCGDAHTEALSKDIGEF